MIASVHGRGGAGCRRPSRRLRSSRGAALWACGLLLAVSPAAPRRGVAGPEGVEHVVRGRHVQVRGAVEAALVETAADLGDHLAAFLAARWGVDPTGGLGPLHLRLHPDRAAFVAALPRLAPARLEGVGGWTPTDGSRSDVWVQAHAFDTRRLVIHELVHQIQSRTQAAEHRGRGPTWYREGLAEALGHHVRRTDGTWRLVALDVDEAFDENRVAARRVAALGYDPIRMVSSAEPPDYADGLGLVGGLLRLREARWAAPFVAFEHEVLRRGAGTGAFLRRFGSQRLRLAAALRRAWALQGPRAPRR